MQACHQQPLNGKTVLDLACGYGLWGHIIRAAADNGGTDCYLVGCDIWRPYLAISKKYKAYDDFVLCDVKHLPFNDHSVDFAVSFEVIEHLSKTDAYNYLRQLKSISKKVLISTPAGYYPQDEMRGNKYEKHISAWNETDFRKAGYHVCKTGFGIDIERFCRKLHLTGVLQILAALIAKGSWSGFMLIAEYG